jgi:PAS domain S-box-containing protein
MFASLLATIPVAVVATDLESTVMSWNPAAESLFGYSSQEAMGQLIDDLIANRPDLRNEAAAFKAETARTGSFQGITRRMRKDGSLVDVELRAASIEIDGVPSGYYATYHDVTELQRQKQYYESLLELSPTAIGIVDLEDRITAWNPAAQELFGYTGDEAVGQKIDDLVATNDELHGEAVGISARATQGPIQLITRRTRKDGSSVDVDLRVAPLIVNGERIGLFALYHDISELQRQKQYYSSLLELSPTAIVAVDREFRVTSWNEAAEKLFGYTTEEAIGQVIDDLVANDEGLHADATQLSRQANVGQHAQFVRQRTRKDGSLVDVEIHAGAIMVGGERVGDYVIYHDISELQRQRRYYEALFEWSPNAIALLDTQGTVTSWNPAAERLFGYSPPESVGRNIDDLVANDPSIRDEAIAMSEAGVGHEHVHATTRRTRKDGSLVDVELFGAPVIVGNEAVGLYALYHDISELQRQRRYYEALFELSPTAIVTVNPEVKVTSWNQAAERLFGHSREEAIGQDLNDLIAYSDELRAEGMELDRQTARGELHRITRRMRKDGSLVDVDMRAAPMVVAGETVGMFCLYHDISDLQRARRDAEAATEAKSAFLATMSHEIRTPMNAVIGMTDLLMRTRLDDEQRSFADVIRTSGEALLSVINDILDFSKIEAGRLDLESHPFDLRECVESALELVARAAAEKGLDLAYELRPGTPEALVGDSPRLRQILLNLLNNAVKFTPEGEVVVTVEAEPIASSPAHERAEPAGWHRLHFAVRDTGIGIPEDRIGALFESFSQVDASTTRRYGGTGLGLAISKRLSERMGGTMWVDTAAGSGSTFHFTIEAEAAPAPNRLYDSSGERPLAGRRVLILDDNATNRHIVRLHAEAWEMLARDTDQPAQALEWIERGDPFDVAIVDMQMPEMDGVAVARRIREMIDAARLPLILLTSLGRREAEGEDLFAARLAKPIRPSQLYDTLLAVLAVDRAEGWSVEPRPANTPSAIRPGVRILVVEDNPLNRQLALLLLKNIGYRADTAANGVEALEAVQHGRYDVVLMDVQMPEMDGLEATRKIHERLGSKRPRIIAATANATQDERERCLAAGMDDYLSKPIRLEELAQALARQLPEASPTTSDPAGAATVPLADQPDGIDGAAIERLRATIGDADTGELIGTFLEEAPKLLASMRNAARHGDLGRLRVAAHTLKSNAATFGATELSELSRQIERLAEEGSESAAPDLIDRAERDYERVRPILEEWRGRR